MLRGTATLLLALLVATGCAYSIVKPVAPGDSDSGYRYYDPLPLLLEGCTKTEVFYIPNFSRGYAVQPRAWLSKNTHELSVAAGQLTQTKGTLDTTAFLTFLQNAATEAIKAAGTFAALSTSDTMGLTNRRRATVHRFVFDEGGGLTGMEPLFSLGECPVGAGGAGGRPAAGGKK